MRTQSEGRATIVIEPDVIVVAKSGYIDAYGHDGRHFWTQPLTGMGVGATALGFPGNVAQAEPRVDQHQGPSGLDEEAVIGETSAADDGLRPSSISAPPSGQVEVQFM